jgi:hypothetical protein
VGGGGGGSSSTANSHHELHAQSIAALQTQLDETQNSLAGHVGKIRDLEGLLAEHEVIKREVGTLRKQMEDSQRDMDQMMRRAREEESRSASGRESPIAALLEAQEERGREEESRSASGRESPIAALLEAQEAADDDDDDDDDDARSVSSADTVSPSSSSIRPNGVIGGLSRAINGATSRTRSVDASTSSKEEDDKLARERQLLQDQNVQLSTRLETLSAELDEATKLGQLLRSQHAEASSTIRQLEERVHGLEKAVEGRVAEVEGKVLQEVEVRWTGWKEAFEEGWKKERKSWEDERDKLRAVVKEWEERRRASSSSEDDGSEEGGEWEEGAVDAPAREEGGGGDQDAGTTSSSILTKGTKAKRPRSRRRRTTTTTTAKNRVGKLAKGGDLAASDSDSTIDESVTRGAGSGVPAWNGPHRAGDSSRGAFQGSGGGVQGGVGSVSRVSSPLSLSPLADSRWFASLPLNLS